jgi:RND superfamily putative drug exporter
MGETASSARLLDSAMGAGEERLTQLEAPIEATEARLAEVLAALRGMTDGRSDPQFRAALAQTEDAIAWLTGTDPRSGEAFASSEGANAWIDRARGQFSLGSYLARRQAKNGETAAEGVAKLAESSTRLDRGLTRLATSSQRIDEAVGELSDGGQELSPALDRLDSGLERVSGGLGSLQEGSGQLAGALGGGAERSKLLSGALDKIDDSVERQRGEGGGLSSLQERSPGMFDSGYFYLASLDGGSAESRRKAGFLVSLERGGHTARMLVIPRHAPTEAGAAETRERIEDDAELLAQRTGTDVVVGGLSAVVPDLDSTFSSQSTNARIAMALVTVVILLLVLRSLPMAVIAALLNLLTVATTFGILALLFDGSLLGGPGYVDTAVVPVSVVVIFALAIDYEVFLFSRMREEYARTGSSEEAIANSLERTAPVITGAALIMIAVFLAFATTSFTTIRNFGVAEAVAVFIDAFIVRLILVPAIMRMLGEKAWWMPRWLERLVPGGSQPVEGIAREGAA